MLQGEAIILAVTSSALTFADKQFIEYFISILWDTRTMVSSTTETCWWLSICNKIHFTKEHSLICYILLHLTFFLADFFCLLVGSSWEIIHLTLKNVTPVKTASLIIKPMTSEWEIVRVSTIFPTDFTVRKTTYKEHKSNLTLTLGLCTHSTKNNNIRL